MDSPPVETKRLDGEEPNGEEPSRGRFQKKWDCPSEHLPIKFDLGLTSELLRTPPKLFCPKLTVYKLTTKLLLTAPITGSKNTPLGFRLQKWAKITNLEFSELLQFNFEQKYWNLNTYSEVQLLKIEKVSWFHIEPGSPCSTRIGWLS